VRTRLVECADIATATDADGANCNFNPDPNPAGLMKDAKPGPANI